MGKKASGRVHSWYSACVRPLACLAAAVLLGGAFTTFIGPVGSVAAASTKPPKCSFYTDKTPSTFVMINGERTFPASPNRTVPSTGECKNINLVLSSISNPGNCARFRVRFFIQPSGQQETTNWQFHCRATSYQHKPLATNIMNGTIYRIETSTPNVYFKIYH